MVAVGRGHRFARRSSRVLPCARDASATRSSPARTPTRMYCRAEPPSTFRPPPRSAVRTGSGSSPASRRHRHRAGPAVGHPGAARGRDRAQAAPTSKAPYRCVVAITEAGRQPSQAYQDVHRMPKQRRTVTNPQSAGEDACAGPVEVASRPTWREYEAGHLDARLRARTAYAAPCCVPDSSPLVDAAARRSRTPGVEMNRWNGVAGNSAQPELADRPPVLTRAASARGAPRPHSVNAGQRVDPSPAPR